MIRLRPAVTAACMIVARPATADTTINFFGDLDYKLSHTALSTDNTFQASTLDIFASQTEGKFTFVGEIVMEAFGSNDFTVDVDRLEVAYQARPWLRLRAGRIRSAFGYYGDAYQNGKFFMTPVSWPEMYEGDGFDGIAPSHALGVHADVSHDLGHGNGKVTLDVEVLNGRAVDLDEVSAFKDPNNSKAFNTRLRYVGQDALEGFVVGGNFYIDDIPEDADADADEHPAMHEVILGAHAAYEAHDVHAIAEAAWFRHRDHGTDIVHTTLAAFGELGYTMNDITPYGRVEYFNFGANGDPYFEASGLSTFDRVAFSAGVKYVASASVSLKIQAGVDVDDVTTRYVGIAQAAFAF
jgi:hypothetical protein